MKKLILHTWRRSEREELTEGSKRERCEVIKETPDNAGARQKKEYRETFMAGEGEGEEEKFM
jgi:hypothetical protein